MLPPRRSPLIVALDIPDAAAALRLATLLQPYVAMVKVGLETFFAGGTQLVQRLRQLGLEVFLDLKLHDIPRTAAAAAAQLAPLDVRLLTVHAAGGPDMVRAVRCALPAQTAVLAVTVLTSLDDAQVVALGMGESAAHSAQRLGTMARQHGADGLVCSSHELATLKPLGGLRVVPGIRLDGPVHDQRRVATPAQALAAGATYLVVGRAVVAAPDPVAAAQTLLRACSGDLV
jgi:orotidine-5'-phosphate decarboxylase